jgi:hypothetical protein
LSYWTGTGGGVQGTVAFTDAAGSARTAACTIAAGDIITLVAPANVDATLADVMVTLKGSV